MIYSKVKKNEVKIQWNHFCVIFSIFDVVAELLIVYFQNFPLHE